MILLSRTPTYQYVRVGGALLAGVAATAWIIERLTEQPNLITHLLESERTKSIWLLIALAIFAGWTNWRFRKTHQSNSYTS
ncbi:hypothetical protein [Spirosoma pomorum]